MASTQCESKGEIDVQLSLEEKASLDEITKQAEFSLESQELFKQSNALVVEKECLDNDAAAKLQIVIVGGILKNQTKGPLSVMDIKKFAGHIVKSFPNHLDKAGGFTMSAMSLKGVKAAVVYSGKNKAGVECGWLLAFSDTKATGRRIYAECGRKGKFSNINWAQVEQKLGKAGDIAKPYDKETGTSLYARIVGTTGKSAVGAAFLG